MQLQLTKCRCTKAGKDSVKHVESKYEAEKRNQNAIFIKDLTMVDGGSMETIIGTDSAAVAIRLETKRSGLKSMGAQTAKEQK